MTKEEATKQYLAQISRKLQDVKISLREWVGEVKVAGDYLYHLEGADGVFEYAAMERVWRECVGAIKGGKTDLETLLLHATDEVHARAKQGSRSTSVCSNLARDMHMRAWAEMREILDAYVANIEPTVPG